MGRLTSNDGGRAIEGNDKTGAALFGRGGEADGGFGEFGYYAGAAVGVGANFEVAAELADAFAHALQADAATFGRTWSGRETLAPVAHFQADFAGGAGDADAGSRAAGGAVHVGERFLHDAEDGGFTFAGEASEVRRQLDFDRNVAALGKFLDEPAQRGLQTHFVEQRRMQQVRDGAQVIGHVAQDFQAVGQHVFGPRSQFGRLGLDHAEVHGQRGEPTAGGVVQVAGDAAALFILQMKDAGRKLAEAGVGGIQLAGLIGHFEGFLDQLGSALVDVPLEILAAALHFLLGVLAVGGVDGDADHAQGMALGAVRNFGAGSEPAFFAGIGANDLMLGNPFFAFFGEGRL